MDLVSVIITAGGIGKRMDSKTPKQFMLLNSRPVLMHTIACFNAYDPTFEIIVSLPTDWHKHWEQLLLDFDFTIPHTVVSGGEERYDSVKNALKYSNGEVVLVHDGVRPNVSFKIIEDCIHMVGKTGAVVPTVPVNESMRKVHGHTSKSVDRNEYILVQTPQCFKKEVLEKAYELPYDATITDDATLVERSGGLIQTIDGDHENLKITRSDDLKIVSLYLK